MRSKKRIVVLLVLVVAVCVAVTLLFVNSPKIDVGNTAKESESSAKNTSQSFVSASKTTSSPVFLEDENTYGMELLTKKENDKIKYGVSNNNQTVVPCEYDEISFLSENRILAQKGSSQHIKSSEKIVIYDDKGNIICSEGVFTYAGFEKKNGAYEKTGIGAYNKNSDLRQAEYWVIDQNGNKLSEAYTFIERVASTNPQEAYYAVRIDADDLYMDSYRLYSSGKVLEKVDRSHPDGVRDITSVDGKSGNYIYLYGYGTYITGYNSRIGGYGYVAFKVDNIDDWQIGDTVAITHTGKIKYSDPPLGELINIELEYRE